ncbi:hypothetical protein BJV77DRAFT_1024896 [Russula vinacea]|nr:hypothetical protein BJV77DRAFT_1024896 [Russula vinacea]
MLDVIVCANHSNQPSWMRYRFLAGDETPQEHVIRCRRGKGVTAPHWPAEKSDAVLRPGLSYGHRRSASAPRRALVVLRTPMDPARVEKNKQYSTSRLRLPSLATGICDDCSQQLVGELGVPVATSHFSLSRLAPEGDSCECVPVISLVISVSDPDDPAFGSRFALVRHNIFARALGIDPFGVQSSRLQSVMSFCRRGIISLGGLIGQSCWDSGCAVDAYDHSCPSPCRRLRSTTTVFH